MNLSVGIVGLPNIGKSTLFNALLKKQVADVANYPFCTIEPNVGVVEVPDSRLSTLAKIVKTEKIVPAVVEFYDIAGLVKGASKGEGLGNKFLSHIREVEIITHVVRLFEDGNITHVSEKINPTEDAKTIETELILADLSTLSKQEKPRTKPEKEDEIFFEAVDILKTQLNQSIPARKVNLTEDQLKAVKKLNLLTIKPVIYVFNVSENQLLNFSETEQQVKNILAELTEKTSFVILSAKMETEILALDPKDQADYLKQYGLEKTGLDRLISKAYETLGLISFLTAGVKEARAWTIKNGTEAVNAAGTIHTDFTKKFIKADIASFADFVANNGWTGSREKGKVLSAGRDYVIKDDDVVEFKIGS